MSASDWAQNGCYPVSVTGHVCGGELPSSMLYNAALHIDESELFSVSHCGLWYRIQVATGVLFHSSMMTSQSWWVLEILRSSTFHLRMPHRLLLFSASLARQWSSWRCLWGCYHVEKLPSGPVAEGRASWSASVCHSTCWHSWFPQWTVATQCQQHSCSPRP